MSITTAWLAHVDERLTTVREVRVQDPDWNHTQSLKKRRMCCLCYDICKWLDILVFLDKEEKS